MSRRRIGRGIGRRDALVQSPARFLLHSHPKIQKNKRRPHVRLFNRLGFPDMAPKAKKSTKAVGGRIGSLLKAKAPARKPTKAKATKVATKARTVVADTQKLASDMKTVARLMPKADQKTMKKAADKLSAAAKKVAPKVKAPAAGAKKKTPAKKVKAAVSAVKEVAKAVAPKKKAAPKKAAAKKKASGKKKAAAKPAS
jgi:hypothetical protein